MAKTLLLALALSLATVAFAATEVNTATRAELEAVRGVGTLIADTILVERKKGAFKDWADFVGRVRGVSDRNAARLSAAGLTVDGVPFRPAVERP